MTDVSTETKISELSAKVDSLIRGCKAGMIALLVLFSLFNVGDTLAISHFRQIFADALSGRTLPALTSFFLIHQTLLTGLALLWPTLGLLSVFFFKKIFTAMAATSCLLVLILLQLALNWIALFTPLINLAGDISNSP